MPGGAQQRHFLGNRSNISRSMLITIALDKFEEEEEGSNVIKRNRKFMKLFRRRYESRDDRADERIFNFRRNVTFNDEIRFMEKGTRFGESTDQRVTTPIK